jgi:ribosomal protein L40E
MQPPNAKTKEQPGESVKLPIPCPGCAHGNAPDSAFCSACGVSLPVASCPHCGAVNPVAAVSCHQCHGKLSVGGADEPEPAAGAEAVKPSSRRPKRWTAGVLAAGTVVLATLGFLGYQVYEMFSDVDLRLDKASVPRDVSGGAEERRGPVDSGPIGRDGGAADALAPSDDRRITSIPAPASPFQATPGISGRTPVNRQRGPATQGGTGVASAGTSATGEAVKRARPESTPCTEGVVALGLCTQSIQRKE